MIVFTDISDGKDVEIQDIKPKDHAKYDQLLKEHELLKEKLDTVTKELANEKDKKKLQQNAKGDDKNTDLQNSKSNVSELYTP